MNGSFMDQQKNISFNSHDMRFTNITKLLWRTLCRKSSADQSATQVATLRHSAKGVLTYSLDLSPSHKYEVLWGFPTKTEI